MDLELPQDVIGLLEVFLKEYRPLLPGSQGSCLVPGEDEATRSYSAMRDALGELRHKYAGLTVSPHLCRHIVAKIVVERHPELALDVSRRLGHASLNTTFQSASAPKARPRAGGSTTSCRRCGTAERRAARDPAQRPARTPVPARPAAPPVPPPPSRPYPAPQAPARRGLARGRPGGLDQPLPQGRPPRRRRRRRHWSEATRRTNLKHYARWLGWCTATGRLNGGGDQAQGRPTPTPWARATPAAVEAYARTLLAEAAARTVATSLIEHKCVLQGMAPDEDWTWPKRMTNGLKSWTRSQPRRAPRVSKRTAPELFATALAGLERLAQIAAPTARDRQAYRDTLLVALLLACPVRERNLAQMEMARHLVRLGDDWHLRFEPEGSKTGQALHLVMLAALAPFLEEYLARVRPAFPVAQAYAHVWPAQEGRPMV